jgi:hypothetical protein
LAGMIRDEDVERKGVREFLRGKVWSYREE